MPSVDFFFRKIVDMAQEMLLVEMEVYFFLGRKEKDGHRTVGDNRTGFLQLV